MNGFCADRRDRCIQYAVFVRGRSWAAAGDTLGVLEVISVAAFKVLYSRIAHCATRTGYALNVPRPCPTIICIEVGCYDVFIRLTLASL